MSTSTSPRGLRRANMRFLSRFAWYEELLGGARADWKKYWKEIQSDEGLFDYLLGQVRSVGLEGDMRLGAWVKGVTFLGRVATLWKFSASNAELYTLVRCRRPEVIVETGVASGVSSTLILTALARNRGGHLFSIDKPNRNASGYIDSDGKKDVVFTPSDRGPGWLVPTRLHDRWTLLQGPSFDLLPGLLSKLGHIDFFFHDSEHSYGNMQFEFEQASTALPNGGILYSDDVFRNSAFTDFAMAHRRDFTGGVSGTGRGLLVKGYD